MMDRYDVVIVGGGPAGLSAALSLGRARRRVLLLDGNEPRNGLSHAAHNFFTRDGTNPLELRGIGRAQLAPYTTVRIEDRKVVGAVSHDGDFRLRFADGSEIDTLQVILATGVQDILPGIEGYRELWGKSVFFCPYCDGWEVRDEPWAVLAVPSELMEYAALLSSWTHDLVMLTNGVEAIDPDIVQALARMGIPLRTDPIARLEREGDRLRRIVFETGDALDRTILLHRPPVEPRTALAEQLGCELIPDGRPAGLIKVDRIQETTVPGVFAAGDVAVPMAGIAMAVSSGQMAAAAANHRMIRAMLDAA
jgi:thioredoxin reductase